MKPHHAIRLQPGQRVDDVFRVYDIVKRARGRESDYFVVTLLDCTGQFNAIVGKPARAVNVGELVRVRGCVLLRRGEPILVACSLKPVAPFDKAPSDFPAMASKGMRVN